MKIQNTQQWPFILILVGIILRINEYCQNKSFWLDETYVVLNVLKKNWLELFSPLDYGHHSPVGFLLVEKFFINIFGNNEYAFRIFPLLLSIISLFLFYKLASEYVRPRAVIHAIALVSICYALIHYSSEAKPYSGDVFFTMLLFYLTNKFFKEDFSKKDIFIFTIVGAISTWFAFSSVFVLASIGLVLLLSTTQEKKFTKLKMLLPTFFLWGMSFLIFYFFIALRAIDDHFTVDIFSQFYMPIAKGFSSVTWLWNMFLYFWNFIPMAAISLLFLLIGIIAFYLDDKKKFFLFFLPLIFIVVASALQKYPLWQRFLLFLIPIFILFIAQGIETYREFIEERFPKAGKIISIVLIFFVYFSPVLSTSYNALYPFCHQQVRQAMSHVKNNMQNGDILYVHSHLQYGYKYYADRFGFKSDIELEYPCKNTIENRIHKEKNYTLIIGKTSRYNKENKIFYEDLNPDLDQLLGNKRVWLLLTNMKWRAHDEAKYFIQYLNKFGKIIDFYQDQGMEVYLYDFSDKSNQDLHK